MIWTDSRDYPDYPHILGDAYHPHILISPKKKEKKSKNAHSYLYFQNTVYQRLFDLFMMVVSIMIQIQRLGVCCPTVIFFF